MDTNPLLSTLAAVTHAGNRNLSTGPKRLPVIKGWESIMRGARKYGGEQGFVTIPNMLHFVSVTGAGEYADLVNRENVT